MAFYRSGLPRVPGVAQSGDAAPKPQGPQPLVDLLGFGATSPDRFTISHRVEADDP